MNNQDAARNFLHFAEAALDEGDTTLAQVYATCAQTSALLALHDRLGLAQVVMQLEEER